jgi:hypothetical protein
MFLNCSTCFERHAAHHQELKSCNCSLWFYIRLWLPQLSWQPFLFLYHGLDTELLLQVCLRFFVFSFSVMYWRLQVQVIVFYGYEQTRFRAPAWMARTLDFRVSKNQWICLCCGWSTVCAHCVSSVAALSSGQLASLQFFWLCHLDRWVCWVRLQKG